MKKSNKNESLPKKWIRVSEACHYSGLSKPTIYNLLKKGLLRSVSLRDGEQIKATRLISFDSLRGFLESRATGGI